MDKKLFGTMLHEMGYTLVQHPIKDWEYEIHCIDGGITDLALSLAAIEQLPEDQLRRLVRGIAERQTYTAQQAGQEQRAHAFGTYLRTLRKQQGITQRDLANVVGVDFTYISKIENGATPPPSELTIRCIAQAIAVNEEELLDRAGKVPAHLKLALRNNPLAVELVRVMCERELSDDIYRQMLALAHGSVTNIEAK